MWCGGQGVWGGETRHIYHELMVRVWRSEHTSEVTSVKPVFLPTFMWF